MNARDGRPQLRRGSLDPSVLNVCSHSWQASKLVTRSVQLAHPSVSDVSVRGVINRLVQAGQLVAKRSASGRFIDAVRLPQADERAALTDTGEDSDPSPPSPPAAPTPAAKASPAPSLRALVDMGGDFIIGKGEVSLFLNAEEAAQLSAFLSKHT